MKLFKRSSEYKPLQYLLTLPVMSRIKGESECGHFKFEVFGDRGLYKYKDEKNQLTLKELIELFCAFFVSARLALVSARLALFLALLALFSLF